MPIVTTTLAAFALVTAAIALRSPKSPARAWLGVSALIFALGSYVVLTMSVLGVSDPNPIAAVVWLLASSCGGGVLFFEHEAFVGLSLAPKATVLGALASTVLAVVVAAG